MKYKEELFLSARILPGYEQVRGEEATKLLQEQGYRYIHVDEQGNVHALSNDNQYVDGYKVYKRKVPCI